ncbi:MAG: hypothetical protein KBT20_05025 [Bacteroidales bacterium]|nr:hypothetical protein [Candidatus Liminaster caballi]
MKSFSVKQIAVMVSVMLCAMFSSANLKAQVKVDDKEIVGVWIMSSMKFEGENKELISDSYNQVKVYRADGEYACAEIVRLSNGTYHIQPHEYGTYSLKDGLYSEMGRKPIKYEWVDKTTSKGRWMNRVDIWKKVVDFPEGLAQHIVDKCKVTTTSDDMQQKLKQYIFTR